MNKYNEIDPNEGAKKSILPLRPNAESKSPLQKQEQHISPIRSIWMKCTCCMTGWIPSIFLRWSGMTAKEVQQAWREKIALNILIYFACFAFLFYIIGLEMIFCPKTTALSQGEVEGLKKPAVSMYGHYYSISDIMHDHVDVKAYLNEEAFKSKVLGRDVSSMFYKADHFEALCPGLSTPPSGWDSIVRNIDQDALTVWTDHREKGANEKYRDYFKIMRKNIKGPLARDFQWVSNFLAIDPIRNYVIIAYDKVYDVSGYMDTNANADFLGGNMLQIFQAAGKNGKDSTSLIEKVKNLEGDQKFNQYMNCMNNLFFAGVIDHRRDARCTVNLFDDSRLQTLFF